MSKNKKERGVGADEYLQQHLEQEKYLEISLSDLKMIPSFVKLMKEGNQDRKILFKYLYLLGIDTSYNLEEQVCTHRNMSNKVVTCTRWQGYKRTDDEYIKMIKGK